MKFWKMNGAGNDFLVLNNLEEHLPVDRLPEIARILCERRLSIGADGLMVEVHNDPPRAKCDGAQSLTPDAFDDLTASLAAIRPGLLDE